MKHPERRIGVHLVVLTTVVAAVVAALALEGLGFAVIVATACVVLLAVGFPLLVILSEEHGLPMNRRD